jgi:hypothetical protein
VETVSLADNFLQKQQKQREGRSTSDRDQDATRGGCLLTSLGRFGVV